MNTENHKQVSLIETASDVWRRRKWPFLATFFLIALVSFSVILALPPLFRSSSTILIGQNNISEAIVNSSSSNNLQQRIDALSQSILSRSSLLEIIEQHNLYPELRQTASQAEVITRMREDINIEFTDTAVNRPQDNVRTLSISYQTWDPQLAADVTSTITSRFQDQNREIRLQMAASTSEFLREQLAAARQQYLEQERSINDYKDQHLGELPEQEDINLASMERLNAELNLNGEKQIQLMDRRDAMIRDLQERSETGNNLEGQTGLSRLVLLRRQLGELRTRYTDQYPDVVRLKTEISTLEKQIDEKFKAAELEAISASSDSGSAAGGESLDPQPAPQESDPFPDHQYSLEEIQIELNELERREAEIRDTLDNIQRRIELAPQIERELQRLNRGFESARQQYASLQGRYQDALLVESLEQQQNSELQVLEAAVAPEYASAPARSRLLAMFFVLAIGGGAALVFIMEQFDNSFHSLDQLRGFTSVPVLASISPIRTSRDKWGKSARFWLLLAIYLVVVVVLAALAYEFGADNQELVWSLPGA